MTSFEILFSLILAVTTIFLIYQKRSRKKIVYQPYFSQLNHTLKNTRGGISAGIIDLDRIDSNLHCIRTRLDNHYKLRLVTKSLPSFDLLKYLMLKVDTDRLMVFSESFLIEIITHLKPQPLDILLGKALPVEAFMRLRPYHSYNTIQWLIDTKERLNDYLAYTQREHIQIKISLEIDVGLHRGGFQTIEEFIEAVSIIQQNSQYLELTGMMGYDGHVPYVPFSINRKQSIRKAFQDTQELYRQFVNILHAYYDMKMINQMSFNSGGSHTYMYYQDYESMTPVNDIAIGSGFLVPQQFSDLMKLDHQPALFLSSPILKKIPSSLLPHAEKWTAFIYLWDPNLKVSYFMLDGGWPGELISPIGLKKNYFWESNHRGYTNLLPNQAAISSSDENTPDIGDFIFYHAWEGDGILCFKKLVIYRHGGIVGEWHTYQGGN